MKRILPSGRVWAVLMLGAAVGVGVFFVSTSRGQPKGADNTKETAPAEIAITTARVTPRVVERHVEMVGTLEGHDEVTVSAKIDGRVTRLHRDLGDVVGPGEVLAEIDETDYRLGEREAVFGLELELARLGLTEIPGDGKIDMKRVPAIVRASNLEINAKQNLERARRLSSGRSISTEEMDRITTEHRVAISAREQAEMEARTTLASSRLKKAQLETARQKLTDTRVIVPSPSPSRLPPGCTDPKSVRYVVAARKVSEGEMVRSTSAGLFHLIIDRPLKLVATLPERVIGEVKHAQPVVLRVEGYPDQTFPGKVARINPTINRFNRTFTLEVHVPNEEGKLPAGGFVKASVQTRRIDQALTVPEEAVVRFAGVVKVFVVRDGRASGVVVQTGEIITTSENGSARRWVEVRGNLVTGDVVVTSGHSMLSDQTPVRER